jgi:hypothetical protein
VTEHKLQEFEKNVQKAFGWKQGKETVIWDPRQAISLFTDLHVELWAHYNWLSL